MYANGALSSASGDLMSLSQGKQVVLTSQQSPDKARTGKTEAGYDGFYGTVVKLKQLCLDTILT